MGGMNKMENRVFLSDSNWNNDFPFLHVAAFKNLEPYQGVEKENLRSVKSTMKWSFSLAWTEMAILSRVLSARFLTLDWITAAECCFTPVQCCIIVFPATREHLTSASVKNTYCWSIKPGCTCSLVRLFLKSYVSCIIEKRFRGQTLTSKRGSLMHRDYSKAAQLISFLFPPSYNHRGGNW